MAVAAPEIDPLPVARAAARLVAAGRDGALGALADELDGLLGPLPGRVVGALTAECPRAPVKVHGPRAATGAELGRIADRAVAAGAAPAPDGPTWTGRARFAGAERDVLVVPAAGTTFVLELADPEPDAEARAVVAALCGVAAALYLGRAGDNGPAQMADSLAAQTERARVLAELGEAHEAALSGILAALRSRSLGDAAARRAAQDAASDALLELRATGERDRRVSERSADEAFERAAADLRLVVRHRDVALDLAAPASSRLLPAELGNAARAITRGVVLTLLDPLGADAPSRVRVAWSVTADALTVGVRDNGPGGLDEDALLVHRTAERVASLDGTLHVDSAPGWGTTVTATLPLAPLRAPGPSPLGVLHAREREVLDGLVAGRRNREIAAELSVTVHTVKFHVANILRKLEVATRGEAAALARSAGA